jgi:aromatic ring-opening dioxygenase LigB subunit
MPSVGKGEEKKLEKNDVAYREAMRHAASFTPDTVVLISPHAEMYADYFHISPDARAAEIWRGSARPK